MLSIKSPNHLSFLGGLIVGKNELELKTSRNVIYIRVILLSFPFPFPFSSCPGRIRFLFSVGMISIKEDSKKLVLFILRSSRILNVSELRM